MNGNDSLPINSSAPTTSDTSKTGGNSPSDHHPDLPGLLREEGRGEGSVAGTRGLSRRKFMLATGAVASAFSIVPRHVLGGPGIVAPSEKITLACIGFGTQAIREIGGILAQPEVQIVAMCDVEKDGRHYLEWGKGEIRNTIRRLIDNPTWREGADYVPGGRD